MTTDPSWKLFGPTEIIDAPDHLPWCASEMRGDECNCDDFEPCAYCHLVGNCICP